MSVGIPPQRRVCATYDWCMASGQRHQTHVGEVHTVGTSRGTEVRVSLSAHNDEDPLVELEVAFEPGGPAMEVAQLDPAEAVELAGCFLRLARTAQNADRGIR